MKNKVLLFSEYRKEQALFIQEQLKKDYKDLWIKDYYILLLYLEYLEICNFDKRAAKEIEDLRLEFQIDKKYNSYNVDAVENHIEWVDKIVNQYVR